MKKNAEASGRAEIVYGVYEVYKTSRQCWTMKKIAVAAVILVAIALPVCSEPYFPSVPVDCNDPFNACYRSDTYWQIERERRQHVRERELERRRLRAYIDRRDDWREDRRREEARAEVREERIEEREDRRGITRIVIRGERSDRRSECLHKIKRVGTEHMSEANARAAAENAWAEEVRYAHGEKWMDMRYASAVLYTCSKSSIAEGVINRVESALGGSKTRCEIEARPCLPRPQSMDK